MSSLLPHRLLGFSLLLFGAAPLLAQVQVQIGSKRDNTLYEEATGALSNGAGQHFFTGMTVVGVRHRGLVAFDVASVVPAGASIVAVDLTLNMSASKGPNSAVDLHAATADWGEGTSLAPGSEGQGAPATPGDATWLHRFYSTTNWANAGGDYSPTVSGSVTVSVNGSYTWTSTPAMVANVQNWLDNPAQNFGWVLTTSEIAGNSKRFDTRENVSPQLAPYIVVTYNPRAAVTSYGTGCNASAAGPMVQSALGLPVVPNLGFTLRASSGPASAPAALLIALDALPNPIGYGNGCWVYVNPLTVIVTLNGSMTGGVVNFPLPVPNVQGIYGAVLETQVAALDPLGPLSVVSSNALHVLVGK